MAIGALGLGGAVTALGVVASVMPVLAIGIGGLVLGSAYLGSPTWRLAVTIDDDALSVGSPGRERFRLPWSEVVHVLAAPAKATCFVDGGTAERSLLVPGDGAPAPYDIEHRDALVAAILARVPASVVERVESLEAHTAARKRA